MSTDVSEVRAASIIIPADSELHTRRHFSCFVRGGAVGGDFISVELLALTGSLSILQEIHESTWISRDLFICSLFNDAFSVTQIV
jgi:hypothetical protein